MRKRPSNGYLIRQFLPLLLLVVAGGCYAPLHSPGIPASELPASFRMNTRAWTPRLNMASLTIPERETGLVPGDMLEVTINGLSETGNDTPFSVKVLSDGRVYLPMVGGIEVAGMAVPAARAVINDAYANGFVNDPQVNLQVAQQASVQVLVLGEVTRPGVYTMPRNAADVGRALAMASGLTDDAADELEIHRNGMELAGRSSETTLNGTEMPAAMNGPGWSGLPRIQQTAFEGGDVPAWDEAAQTNESNVMQRASEVASGGLVEVQQNTTIVLRGPNVRPVENTEVRLHDGDVITVPRRVDEVFYVVGPLAREFRSRFTLREQDREVGNGFVLPPNRDIDVVLAVAMAGYIDPIESPTTVTVQRKMPNGSSMLILVDLIKARADRCETVNIQAGDIVYLNPDSAWWSRRLFDRVVQNLVLAPWRSWVIDRILR